MIKLSPLAKRVEIVIREIKAELPYKKKAMLNVAEVMGISESALWTIVKGRSQPGQTVVNKIIAYGYAPEWIITGTGPHKSKLKDRTSLTDVQMLRLEVEKRGFEIERLEARMKAYEDELSDIREMLMQYQARV